MGSVKEEMANNTLSMLFSCLYFPPRPWSRPITRANRQPSLRLILAANGATLRPR